MKLLNKKQSSQSCRARKGINGSALSAPLRGIYLIGLSALVLCGCQKQKLPELAPAEVKVEAALAPVEIMVGDSAELVLTIYAPSDSRPEDLALPKEIEVQNRALDSEAVSETHTRFERRLKLTSFELGEFALTNGLVVVAADGTARTNQLENIALKVVSALDSAEDQTLAALKPPMKEKKKYGRLLAVIGLTALIALLAGMLTMWLISRRKEIEAAPTPKIPAHIIAMDALNALKAKGWIEAENAYEFYFELSQIWRTYLEDRFALQAPESTTEEIAEKLEKSAVLADDDKSMLKQFLRQADMIKFAKETQTSEGMQQAYALCTDFVTATQEQPEVES